MIWITERILVQDVQYLVTGTLFVMVDRATSNRFYSSKDRESRITPLISLLDLNITD